VGNYATIANHTACTTSPSSLCADFSASDNVTGTFTTAGPLPANASDLEIGATVVSYSLFSGLDTIASTNADARLNTLRISTDASGNITGVNLLHAVLWQTGSVPHSTADRFAAITLVPGNNGVSTRNSGCTTVGTGDSGIADTCLVATITDASRSTAYNAPVAVSMAPVPSAPQNPAATAGNGQATVSWNEPASGGPFTLYTVTSVEDPSKSCTATPPTTSCVVPSLANGTSYTFTVRASNANGPGADSTATAPVTPAAPPTPSAPQNPAATAGNGQATVSWSEPASGGPFTLYTVTAVEDPSKSCTATPPATSCVVPNLANGTPYTFTVRASNANGPGADSSATAPVTPAAPPTPSAPQNPAATAGNGQATVSWSEPASGGPFTLYTVTAVEDPSKSCTATPPATSCVVPNLANGTSYTFTVRASNASGMGAASTATAPVTPAAPTPSGPAPIPTLSEWALLALSSLLALAAVFARRRPG